MADDNELNGDDVGWWNCSLCTYKNSADKFKCEICDLRRGTSTRKPRCSADTIVAQVVKQQEQIRQQTKAKPSPKSKSGGSVSQNAANSNQDSTGPSGGGNKNQKRSSSKQKNRNNSERSKAFGDTDSSGSANTDPVWDRSQKKYDPLELRESSAITDSSDDDEGAGKRMSESNRREVDIKLSKRKKASKAKLSSRKKSRKGTNTASSNQNPDDSESGTSEATDELSPSDRRSESPLSIRTLSSASSELTPSPPSSPEPTTSSPPPNNHTTTPLNGDKPTKKENPFKIRPVELYGNLIKYSPPTSTGRTGLIIDKKRFTQHSVTVDDVTITFTEFATRQNNYVRKSKKKSSKASNSHNLAPKIEPKVSTSNSNSESSLPTTAKAPDRTTVSNDS